MNNMNTVPLPEDVWNKISYELNADKLQSLAVCSKELNCFMSKNQGLQLYNSITPCINKLADWSWWGQSRETRVNFKETIETSIKIHEYHFLNPLTITYRDIVSLNAWTNAVLKNDTLRLILNDNVTYQKFINLSKIIETRNFQKNQF